MGARHAPTPGSVIRIGVAGGKSCTRAVGSTLLVRPDLWLRRGAVGQTSYGTTAVVGGFLHTTQEDL